MRPSMNIDNRADTALNSSNDNDSRSTSKEFNKEFFEENDEISFLDIEPDYDDDAVHKNLSPQSQSSSLSIPIHPSAKNVNGCIDPTNAKPSNPDSVNIFLNDETNNNQHNHTNIDNDDDSNDDNTVAVSVHPSSSSSLKQSQGKLNNERKGEITNQLKKNIHKSHNNLHKALPNNNISKAIAFLRHPQIESLAPSIKESYLRSKGLSQLEIDEATRRLSYNNDENDVQEALEKVWSTKQEEDRGNHYRRHNRYHQSHIHSSGHFSPSSPLSSHILTEYSSNGNNTDAAVSGEPQAHSNSSRHGPSKYKNEAAAMIETGKQDGNRFHLENSSTSLSQSNQPWDVPPIHPTLSSTTSPIPYPPQRPPLSPPALPNPMVPATIGGVVVLFSMATLRWLNGGDFILFPSALADDEGTDDEGYCGGIIAEGQGADDATTTAVTTLNDGGGGGDRSIAQLHDGVKQEGVTTMLGNEDGTSMKQGLEQEEDNDDDDEAFPLNWNQDGDNITATSAAAMDANNENARREIDLFLQQHLDSDRKEHITRYDTLWKDLSTGINELTRAIQKQANLQESMIKDRSEQKSRDVTDSAMDLLRRSCSSGEDSYVGTNGAVYVSTMMNGNVGTNGEKHKETTESFGLNMSHLAMLVQLTEVKCCLNEVKGQVLDVSRKKSLGNDDITGIDDKYTIENSNDKSSNNYVEIASTKEMVDVSRKLENIFAIVQNIESKLYPRGIDKENILKSIENGDHEMKDKKIYSSENTWKNENSCSGKEIEPSEPVEVEMNAFSEKENLSFPQKIDHSFESQTNDNDVTKIGSLALSKALRRLIEENESSSNKIIKECAQMLFLYNMNLSSNPNSKKYRKIHTNNSTFKNKVGKVKGAKDVLFAVGFVDQGTCLEWKGDEIDAHELESLVESTNNRKFRRVSGTSDNNDTYDEEAESPAIMLLNEAVVALSELKTGGKEALATLKVVPSETGERKNKSFSPKDSCNSPSPPPPLPNEASVDTSIPSTGTIDPLVH